MKLKYSYSGMGKWLRGPEATRMTKQAGERARAAYQSIVAHRTGRLAESAKVTMSTGLNGRPVATLGVGGADAVYGLAHEFGFEETRDEHGNYTVKDAGTAGNQAAHDDLRTVLGML